MPPTPDRSSIVRVSDAERERYVAVLRRNCGDGRLSLDEFADRVTVVYSASDRAELDEAVSGLPVPWAAPASFPADRPASPSGARVAAVRDKIRARRWHLAIVGETIRKGSYRLAEDAAAVAICGECVLDLTKASLAAASVTVDAVAICGQVTIIVPPGINVAADGLAIVGEKRFDDDRPLVDGAPTLFVRALAICGAVHVRRSPMNAPLPVPDGLH